MEHRIVPGDEWLAARKVLPIKARGGLCDIRFARR